MRWQHRTTAYGKSANNGIGNDNNGNAHRNNTACNGGRADRGRKRTSPDREQGSDNRANHDRYRAYNNGKAEGRTQAYQTKGGTHCTAHYVREQVLDEIVLGRVQKMTAFAREKPEEFYAMATANGEAEAKKFYSMAERQKSSLENRVKEIDKFIRCLYEDRVVGRITPERYDELACGYELEQTEIKQELKSITARIAEMDMRDICVREFIANTKEIVNMEKLTPKILRAFIHRIDVYEKAEKFSRKCGNYVEIHYTFQPKPRTTSETAVSTIAVIPMELQMAALNA